jgi:hypothetical protein
MNDALETTERVTDRFTLPLVASRIATWSDSLLIEPGESEVEDFEFVVPSEVSAARVYAWIKNDELSTGTTDIGWHSATTYSFKSPKK